jgi:inorganic pyrophosphatase
MKNTTTGLMEGLLQTLDVEWFIKEVREFDQVTQRQCFLKALKELRKPGIVGLHGLEEAKSAVKGIRDALENIAHVPVP